MKINLIAISNHLRILIIPVLLASLPINAFFTKNFGISNGMPASGLFPSEDSQTSTLKNTDYSNSLQLTAIAHQLAKIQHDNQGWLEVSFPGWEQSDAPDLPFLPVQSAMLSIPSDAQPNLQVRSYRLSDRQFSGYSNITSATTLGCQQVFIPLIIVPLGPG